MRLPTYLVQSPTGVFHFRWVVPKPWRERVGCKVVKRSLGTRSPRAAQLYALTLVSLYAQILRGSTMGKDALEQALRAAQNSKEFELVPTKGGDFRLKTDGTPEDNAAGLEALRTAVEARAAQRQLLASQTPLEALPSLTPTNRRMALDTAMEKWGSGLIPKDTRDKTPDQKQLAVRDFQKWLDAHVPRPSKVSRRTVETLGRNECAEWVLYQKAQPGQKKGELTAPTTIVNRMGYLADFFGWCMSAGCYPKGDNPAEGHIYVSKAEKASRSVVSGWKPFTPEQIKLLLENLGQITKDAGRWVTVIALYTGARSNEIAQLELLDFKIKDGVKVFHFTEEGDDKSQKNAQSDRYTPIHPDLITLGLWKRVERLKEAGETKLFPDLTFHAKNGPANAPQKALLYLMKKLKVKARGKGKMGLHSFRKTVVQWMQDKHIEPEYRRAFVGHAEGGEKNDIHLTVYSKRPSMPVLSEKCLPALDFAKAGVIDLVACAKLLK